MNTSLILLIVLIVIVLAVILATSETGKDKMTHFFSKKSPKAQKKPEALEAASRPKMAKPRTAPKRAAPVKASKPVIRKPKVSAPKPTVAATPTTGTLSGDLLTMFTPDVDDISEFGVTQATMDELADEYRKSHLIAAKDSRTRHRSYRSSAVEEAEKKLQESFMIMAREARHEYDPEFVSNVMRENILKSGTNVRSNRGRTAKRFTPSGNQ